MQMIPSERPDFGSQEIVDAAIVVETKEYNLFTSRAIHANESEQP
jgi:hypothetical protein